MLLGPRRSRAAWRCVRRLTSANDITRRIGVSSRCLGTLPGIAVQRQAGEAERAWPAACFAVVAQAVVQMGVVQAAAAQAAAQAAATEHR